MFLFKKIVSQFFFPMPLCLAVCFTGLAFLWWTRRQQLGKVLVTAGLLLLTALSYSPVANALLQPLEQEFAVYVSGTSPPVDYVVVLGGGHNSDPRLPLSSRLSDESLKRLLEGIRVFRENPGSKLIVSGGAWIDPIPEAQIFADVAELLGIERGKIILEGDSRDTEDEARLLKPVLSTNRIALVTSSNHMPRAMACFRREGMEPIAAPTDYLVKKRRLDPSDFFPNSRCLRRSERAVYEYLGAIWGLARAH